MNKSRDPALANDKERVLANSQDPHTFKRKPFGGGLGAGRSHSTHNDTHTRLRNVSHIQEAFTGGKACLEVLRIHCRGHNRLVLTQRQALETGRLTRLVTWIHGSQLQFQASAMASSPRLE